MPQETPISTTEAELAGLPVETVKAMKSEKEAIVGKERHWNKGLYGELVLFGLVLLAVAIFAAGYGVGNRDTTFRTAWYMPLYGIAWTAEAPKAVGDVQGGPIDEAGNTPIELSVRGLALLATGDKYSLYLVLPGRTYRRCGDFTVGKGMTTVRLTVPGLAREPLGWVVARETAPDQMGPVLLRATRSRVH